MQRFRVIAETSESMRSCEMVAVAPGNGSYIVCCGRERKIRNERWLRERGESNSRVVCDVLDNLVRCGR